MNTIEALQNIIPGTLVRLPENKVTTIFKIDDNDPKNGRIKFVQVKSRILLVVTTYHRIVGQEKRSLLMVMSPTDGLGWFEIYEYRQTPLQWEIISS